MHRTGINIAIGSTSFPAGNAIDILTINPDWDTRGCCLGHSAKRGAERHPPTEHSRCSRQCSSAGIAVEAPHYCL
jgi:hypothetical protein